MVLFETALKKTREASQNVGRSILDFAVFIKAVSKRQTIVDEDYIVAITCTLIITIKDPTL